MAAAAADAPPELFVNQLVTSSLEWKQQGVVVNQTAGKDWGWGRGQT